MIRVLRWILGLAVIAIVAYMVLNCRWEGRLNRANHTFHLELGQAPLWDPPPLPQYRQFEKDFNMLNEFPAEGSAGLSISRGLELHRMAIELLLYIWPVMLSAGLLYLVTRNGKRNLTLHLALSIGIGLTVAAMVCIGLSMLFGGFGLLWPGLFGGLGLVCGIVFGVRSFNRQYSFGK